ncbi:maker322 [Drosophila busckii]|uniref:Maker322 n=1 Tax=Drosophila busckii TaxID=30019 RepID=A0A0M5J358_DROBS|nr:maker322 [Drosophila busckii]
MAEPGSGKNYPITSYEELLLHRQMCRQEKRKEQKRLKRQRKALAAQSSDWRLSAEQRKHMRKDIRQTRRELRADRKQERAERRKRRAEAKQKAVAVARCSLKMQELCLREEMPQSAKSNELPKVAAATRGMTQQLSIAGATNKPRIAQIVAAQPPLTESSRETLLHDNDDDEAEYADEDDDDDVDDDDEYVDEAEDDTDAFDEMQFNDRVSCILRSLYEDNVGLAEDLTQLDLAIFPAEQGNESALKQKTASKTRAATAATPKQQPQPQPQPLKAASKPNGFFSQLFMPPLLKLLNQQSSHSCSSNGNSKLPQNQRYLRALHDLRVSQAVHAISKARRQLQHKAAGTESEDVYEHNLKRIVNNQLAIERRVAGLLPHARAVQV